MKINIIAQTKWDVYNGYFMFFTMLLRLFASLNVVLVLSNPLLFNPSMGLILFIEMCAICSFIYQKMIDSMQSLDLFEISTLSIIDVMIVVKESGKVGDIFAQFCSLIS